LIIIKEANMGVNCKNYRQARVPEDAGLLSFTGINEDLEYRDTASFAVLPDFSLLNRKTIVL
jgi:hypothetical protein